MDDYEPWLTPCDPDFDPEKCESAYALWAVKEEGEPVKFLEASITDNLDYPSGYWFFWRTISFSEETGRLIEGEWGGAGDICRADYVADMVLPGGAVFARVQGELDDGIPFDWEVRRPLDDCAKTRAAEAIRAGILALPLSASASIEAIPSPYKIDVSIVHGGTLTHDMARNLLVSAEHYYRDSALCGLLDNWNGLAVAQRALLVQAAKSMREDSPDEAFASLSRAIALIRATDERAGDVSDHTLAHNLLISGFEEMERDNTKLISRQISEGRLDIGEIARAFVGAMGRKTGAALDAALEGKHAGCYSRDVDALVFTDDDIDDYANMIEHGRPDLDYIQCREIASQAVTDWNDGHAMDGFTEFLYDYSDEHAPAESVKQGGGIRHLRIPGGVRDEARFSPMPLGWPSRRPPLGRPRASLPGWAGPSRSVSRTRPKASGRSRPRSASAMRRSLAAGRSLPPSTWSGRCLGASAPPLRPSRSAPSRRPHPRRQATCRRAIQARRPSNGDIPRRQPSQPPSSCSKVSRLIPIGGPAISALPVREALFYRLAARRSSRSGNTVVPP